jgi:hypothetical protein
VKYTARMACTDHQIRASAWLSPRWVAVLHPQRSEAFHIPTAASCARTTTVTRWFPWLATWSDCLTVTWATR